MLTYNKIDIFSSTSRAVARPQHGAAAGPPDGIRISGWLRVHGASTGPAAAASPGLQSTPLLPVAAEAFHWEHFEAFLRPVAAETFHWEHLSNRNYFNFVK